MIKSERKTLKGNYKNIIFLIIRVIVVCLITYFIHMIGSNHSFSIKFENLSIVLGFYIFISSMVAKLAIVLPRISRSPILLIFGIYTRICNRIKEIFKLNLEYLLVIVIFCIGIIVAIFVTVMLEIFT